MLLPYEGKCYTCGHDHGNTRNRGIEKFWLKDLDRISDTEILDWAKRHDLKGTSRELILAFEDARTMRPNKPS